MKLWEQFENKSAFGTYIVLMLLTSLPLMLVKNKDKRRKVSVILIFVLSLIYSTYLLLF